MTPSRSSRLAELVAPIRGRPRYAPLTAGLLARKGEAAPANPFFSAEALGFAPTLASGARLQLGAPEGETDAHDFEWEAHEARMHARPRRPSDDLNGLEHPPDTKEKLPAGDGDHGHVHGARDNAARETRAALTIELELQTLARLVLEARKRVADPARVIEAALAAHLPATVGACPLCEHERPGQTP
jgi:hypothetical protein